MTGAKAGELSLARSHQAAEIQADEGPLLQELIKAGEFVKPRPGG